MGVNEAGPPGKSCQGPGWDDRGLKDKGLLGNLQQKGGVVADRIIGSATGVSFGFFALVFAVEEVVSGLRGIDLEFAFFVSSEF